MSNGENQVVVELFRAEWCGHCKNFAQTWEKLSNNHKNIKWIKYELDDNECRKSNGEHTCNSNSKIAEERGVHGYPTIHITINGKRFVYNRERTEENILNFIKDNSNAKIQRGGECGCGQSGGCGENGCGQNGGKKNKTNKLNDDAKYEMKYYKYKAKYLKIKDN